jgi:hypothetical protein
MGFSARAHDRILKVARSIADLGGSAGVSAKHVEAAGFIRGEDESVGEMWARAMGVSVQELRSDLRHRAG